MGGAIIKAYTTSKARGNLAVHEGEMVVPGVAAPIEIVRDKWLVFARDDPIIYFSFSEGESHISMV